MILTRVDATEAALLLVRKLKLLHGPLMFFQSGGCCDGSAPTCYQEGEMKLGERDVLLGQRFLTRSRVLSDVELEELARSGR